ncbi:MAG: hypothetical protein KVP17_000865 [Porospora cf. gigantea B]|uniref:uncharacterized protein n=1 Tax=Porospora cf. gigantea B TaxID=2853592 RepID=UPI0035718285|nr:MAG: hypothetical protein KVP17_000865 [Porospora cf. gigantea B]
MHLALVCLCASAISEMPEITMVAFSCPADPVQVPEDPRGLPNADPPIRKMDDTTSCYYVTCAYVTKCYPVTDSTFYPTPHPLFILGVHMSDMALSYYDLSYHTVFILGVHMSEMFDKSVPLDKSRLPHSSTLPPRTLSSRIQEKPRLRSVPLVDVASTSDSDHRSDHRSDHPFRFRFHRL